MSNRTNQSMINAKKAHNDEFYTRMEDIEKELSHYSEHFAGKSVYLCCDSPRASKFWEYFEARFTELGLTKLVATHYFHGKDTEAAILEMEDGEIVRRDVPLAEKGDFHSPECRAYMEAADIVVTNPPFSEFHDLMMMIDEIGVDYLMIASNLAITYKTVLEMAKEGRCRAGVNNVRKFEVSPGKYEYVAAIWITSLDHGVKKSVNPIDAPISNYPHYINHDAIEVGYVRDIPKNYCGAMGVPVSFFTKWDPDEYEIISIEKHAIYLKEDGSAKKAASRIMIRRKSRVEKPACMELVRIDNRFEEEAHAVSEQVLITDYGTRLYALTPRLSYKGSNMAFAIPLRSNIRWDTPPRWCEVTENSEWTEKGKRAGFDCTKMIPVSRKVVSLYRRRGNNHPAQRTLHARYPRLIEKAQEYLLARESLGASNTFETDIDAIARWVLPRFT